MKHCFAIVLVLFSPLCFAHASVPILIEQESIRDITPIEDPTLSQSLYGTLDGFPHTYEVRADEPFLLRAAVLIPDTSFARENVSGIIIREIGQQGRVREVTRMLAQDASWESFYDFSGGDSYRRGGVYEAEVEPGVYRIEVSTPDNQAPYVLEIGTRDEFGTIGYMERVKRLMEVKSFFGKSKIRIIESPYVYVPLLVGVLIVVYWLWRRRRTSRTS
jgi:hypothetical protein